MQATARRLSVVSAESCARRRHSLDVRLTSTPLAMFEPLKRLFGSRQPSCLHNPVKGQQFCSFQLQRHSKPVLNIMAAAGWYCGRSTDVTKTEFPAMRELQAEFGDLNFLSPTGCVIYDASFQQAARFDTLQISALLARNIALFGCTVAFCDTSDLFIDDLGCVYFLDSETDAEGFLPLYKFGEDIHSGLEALLSGDINRRFHQLVPSIRIPFSQP